MRLKPPPAPPTRHFLRDLAPFEEHFNEVLSPAVNYAAAALGVTF